MLRVNEQRYSRVVQPRHAHAETTVTMVLAGSLHERVGTREEIARPLSIVVKPRDTEHANEFGDVVQTVQIVLPPAAATRLELADRGFRVWRWIHTGSAVPSFLRLVRAQRNWRAGIATAEHVESLAYDALAALSAAIPSSTSGEAPRWLASIREALDDGQHAPVQQLADAADIHPVYLARQFRRWYGVSITEYRSRRRVQHAAAAIAAPDRTLSFVAHHTGFADQAHMCRHFARETGMTPSAYRDLLATNPLD